MNPIDPAKQAQIDSLLEKPLLARLATVNPLTFQPHVVPVWFGWDGESLWISAFRSTRKVRELMENRFCAIVIDEDAADHNTNWGVLFEGPAELVIEPPEVLREKTTWIYTRYLGPQGVLAPDPQSWIADPENLLIKLTPARTYAWFPEGWDTDFH